ncbi:MAG: glycosyltransferase family 39 protein [Candidatus Altiarchaeota archaeon]
MSLRRNGFKKPGFSPSSLMRAEVMASALAFLIVFYMLSPGYIPPGLDGVVPIDSVDVGSVWSEVTHYYWPRNLFNSQYTVLYYPGNKSYYDNHKIVYEYDWNELFYVKSVPGKDLVMVKRYDVTNTNLVLTVFADGKRVGDFFVWGPEDIHYFKDQIFTIPAEFITRNETKIKIMYDASQVWSTVRGNGFRSFHYYFYVNGSIYRYYLIALVKSIAVAAVVFFIFSMRVNILSRNILLVPLLFVFTVTPSAVFGYYLLGAMPHTPDGVTQLLQAKLILNGKFFIYSISDPAIDSSYSLSRDFVYLRNAGNFLAIHGKRVYGKYLVAFPLLLAIGEYLKASFMVNPIIGGLAVVALFYLGLEVFNDRRLAFYTALLMAVSPWSILMSSSYMNNTLAMLSYILFLLAYMKSIKNKGDFYPLLAGLSLGLLLNIRIYNLVLFLIPFILHALWSRKITLEKLIPFAASFSVMLIMFLGYNYLVTGNMLKTPFQEYNESELPGFHMGAGKPLMSFESRGHTVEKGFLNTYISLSMLDDSLFGGIGLLYIAFLFFLFFYKKDVVDYLFSSIIMITIFGYFIYYYHCKFFGPRYYYELMPIILLLTVRSFTKVEVLHSNYKFLTIIVLACAVSSLIYLHSNMALNSGQHGIDTRLVKMFKEIHENEENAVVFARFIPDYITGSNLAGMNFDDDVVILNMVGETGDVREFSLRNFPNRRCLIFKVVGHEYELTDC